MPSSTFFTTPPAWHWLIILYFFFGGIAGGSFLIGALIDLFGWERDWPLARLAYYVAFVAVIFCPIFLTLDLDRPERFWHMLIQDHTWLPVLKYWSPISFGSWILLLFSIFAFLAFVAALSEARRLPVSMLVLRRNPLRALIAIVGGILALAFASYTGMLLTVTNRPLWADNQVLGLLFVASGAATAAALLVLIGHWRATVTPRTLHRLSRMESWSSLLELVALILLVISLGQVARVWANLWGVALALAVLFR